MILAIALLAAAAIGLVVLWRRATRDADLRATRVGALEGEIREAAAREEGIAARLQATQEEARSVRELNLMLADRNSKLSKFEAMVDAEATAAATLAEIEQDATDLIASARLEAASLSDAAIEIVNAAKTEAEAIKTRAADEMRDSQSKSESLLRAADVEALRLVENAKKQAVEISGDALAAVTNARLLEQTAKAMKNVIEGYGDKYLVPTFSLLDELGERFGHTEAGQMLKSTRDRIRAMVKTGAAASCEYVEENRRNTAIAFILDAFNGKAESILSDVRHDNFGTLNRRLADALALVNHNGTAFRNAKIEGRYFEARKDELRWAVAVHELKEREKEEQRAIRERMREEARVQRDYERSIRDAAKEEGSLRKAMERMQAQMAAASAEQKAAYEEQLTDLTQKLRLMEEKNQRALSMAQQTRSGHVYIISNIGSFGEDVFKIGMTRRLEPLDRVRELGDASVPFEFDVHAMIRAEDAPTFENELHRNFVDRQINKINPRKEFFRVELGEIRKVVEGLGVEATWTMAAECRQYKESKALERDLVEGKIDAERWRASQIKESPILHRIDDEDGDDMLAG